jgi:poly-gamma-glutamate capsule biosynthesis protein CapA/YwtB (metallophosphatase superfamily)
MRRIFLPLFFFPIAVSAACGQTPTRLRLTFLGDIMAHTTNYWMDDFHEIYAGLKDMLLADDLTVGNLEFPVDQTRPVSGYPLFNSRREYWQAAVDSGVDVFSQSNNHSFDQGVEGIFQTLRSTEVLRSVTGHPVYVSGIRGNSAAPFEPVEIRIKGLRIGFLAATQFLNLPGGRPYVNLVNYHDKTAADAFIRLIREKSGAFDLFIVSYHCGVEYSSKPRKDLVDFFERITANGAHIVFGHHPHVYQSFGLVKAGGETRVVMPSMGNFISGMTWGLDPLNPGVWASTGDSALVRVDLLRVGTSMIVIGAEALPISNYLNGKREMVVGKLDDLASGRVPLSSSWKAYFNERLAAMKKLMNPVVLW